MSDWAEAGQTGSGDSKNRRHHHRHWSQTLFRDVWTRFIVDLSVAKMSSGRRQIYLRAPLLLALAASLAGLSCGDPVVVIDIAAPASVTAGSPFSVTLTVMANGSLDKIFNSPVHFTSSDAAAVLPADYTFTAADAGSHTFTNGVALMTPGKQTIRAADRNAPSITGIVSVTVSPVTTPQSK